MAQQTINVGTAPNDGTGTPLRTAFQYTNSNFSELYTAVGPSGNNIVVPGSATITGDLTVRTNKLAVTSTGVAVGATSAAYPLDVTGIINTNSDAYVQGGRLALYRPAGASYIDIASGQDLVFRGGLTTVGGAGASDFMRLNSTGLGVGGSPTRKLSIVGSGNTYANINSGDNTSLVGVLFGGTSAPSNGQIIYNNTDNSMGLYTSGAVKLTIDTSGNVGIGVTPSAWSSMLALQVRGASLSCDATVNRGRLFTNAFYDGAGYKYIQTNFASMYLQNSLDGVQSWHTAPSGTAGTAITFTQAMTLDASGRLYVGTTSSGGVNGFSIVPDPSTPTCVLNGNATTGGTAYLLYSTGATANRFYVTYAGTVFATNTTISAISDQRLKENVQDIDVGLGAILALKPRKFDWKEGKGKNIKGDRGFIAQEFEQVFPQLVDEWQDKTPEGEAPYKSVRQDLIPVLVKAIQELTARVQTLETR